jgi:hypothetical protein
VEGYHWEIIESAYRAFNSAFLRASGVDAPRARPYSLP